MKNRLSHGGPIGHSRDPAVTLLLFKVEVMRTAQTSPD